MAEQVNQNKYLAAINGSNVITDDAKVKAEVQKIIEEHAAENNTAQVQEFLLNTALPFPFPPFQRRLCFFFPKGDS